MKDKVKDADDFVDALAKKEKKKKLGKMAGKAVAGFKSGSSSAPKTDLSGAKQSSNSAAQEALARRRKNKVYR